MVNRCILNRIFIFCMLQAHFFVGASIDVPVGYQQMAAAHAIPSEMLYSVAMTESNFKLPDSSYRPWPWTINVAGTGYRYQTRQEAYDALLKFMKTHSLKRIDVGIAQVNLGWNGHYFRTYWDAFDPYINLNAAARILRACYDNSPNAGWVHAAGCYHHPAGGNAAETYKSIVRNNLKKIIIPTVNAPLITLPSSQPVPLQTQLDNAVSKINKQPSQQLTTFIIPTPKDGSIWIEPKNQ